MSYKIQGEIRKIRDLETFDSGFTKREFILETVEDQYPQQIAISCLKDKTSLLDKIVVNDVVGVTFDVRGREYNGNYFVTLVCWKLKFLKKGSTADGASAGDDDYDDIPF